MNGFHAFRDKRSAFYEMKRVLKDEGMFIVCFYIQGESRITDLLVKTFLTKKGWFTPPFLTKNEVIRILARQYHHVEFHNDGSVAYFRCVK